MKVICAFCTIVLMFVFCAETKDEKIARMLKEWEQREVFFPSDMVYTVWGKDTVDYKPPTTEYKIVFYVDSIGCTTCKLNTKKWKELIAYFDTHYPDKLSYYFIFHPDNLWELRSIFARDNFDIPVIVDLANKFSELNDLPTEDILHTFLLDKNNQVVLMGNPANNFAIQDLYSQVISGVANEKTNVSKTVVEVEDLTIDMDLGEFDWSEIQKKSSYFQNKGDQLLVINEVKTSCSCISVDYTRKPVLPGDSLCFTVYYQAENSGYVNKSIVVYCNADISPLKLHVKGFGK